MPPAVALAVPAVAGAGMSASQGKKGQNAAQSQANQQLGIQSNLLDRGLSAWQPAANYWEALLSGDPTKIAAAVGPTSDILKGQAGALNQQIAATTPGGGATQSALLQNQMNEYNNMSRLYAGVQPQAASALGQLSALPMQLAAPNVGAGIKANQNIANQNMGKAGQVGQGVGGKVANAGRQPKSSWGQVFGKRQPSASPAPVPA